MAKYVHTIHGHHPYYVIGLNMRHLVLLLGEKDTEFLRLNILFFFHSLISMLHIRRCHVLRFQ